jgi:hypothetical protein
VHPVLARLVLRNLLEEQLRGIAVSGVKKDVVLDRAEVRIAQRGGPELSQRLRIGTVQNEA